MDFDTFTRNAWDEHAEAPEAVAERLAASLSVVQAVAQVAPYAALVAHVLGGHLQRWPQALALLDALRRQQGHDTDAARALDRHTAALRCAAGDDGALQALAADEAIAAQAAAAGMLAEHGDWARAIGLYTLALDAAAAGLPDGAPALRALAVTGNNLAAALEEQADRSAEQTAGMLRAAEGGLQYWQRAGGWLETERAHFRLACSRLQAGLPALAVDSAADCVGICQARQAPALERFFGHAVLARAQHAAGDARAAAGAKAAALAAHDELPADERAWCEQELQALRALA